MRARPAGPGAVLGLALAAVLSLSAAAAAAEAWGVKVGVFKLTSSAPIFVGIEQGFFREAGVEPTSSTSTRTGTAGSTSRTSGDSSPGTIVRG